MAEFFTGKKLLYAGGGCSPSSPGPVMVSCHVTISHSLCDHNPPTIFFLARILARNWSHVKCPLYSYSLPTFKYPTFTLMGKYDNTHVWTLA